MSRTTNGSKGETAVGGGVEIRNETSDLLSFLILVVPLSPVTSLLCGKVHVILNPELSSSERNREINITGVDENVEVGSDKLLVDRHHGLSGSGIVLINFEIANGPCEVFFNVHGFLCLRHVEVLVTEERTDAGDTTSSITTLMITIRIDVVHVNVAHLIESLIDHVDALIGRTVGIHTRVGD